eukprot:TRINITY_DN13429_c1_g1_i1.p1 TRINITY_DN13429_c1_g1~~TRINITY_DN13429_c1_g1_i1.p1  ORF type:complete len:460 (+),score=76.01 TRINITY_DN13429_c1_g1_i1:90-1469(+)
MRSRGLRSGYDYDMGKRNLRPLSISGSASTLVVGSASRASTPVKAEWRRTGAPPAKLVGQLSSTMAAPLEECSTLESLHRVSLQILDRVASQKLALAALVSAVSGRCSSMLRRGWPSIEEALHAMPLLADLWRAGLLCMPGDAARTAVAAAIAALVSGGRKEGLPPGSAPGSLFGTVPGSAGGGSHAVGRESMDQRLQRWCRSCELFSDASSSELLTREGASAVEQQLYEELKRTLAGAMPDDLRKAAPHIKLGSIPLCRGSGSAAARGRPAAEKVAEAAVEAAEGNIAAIAYEALRNSESLTPGQPGSADAARQALVDHGIAEPQHLQNERALKPTSRPQSRTRLARPWSGASQVSQVESISGGAPSSPTLSVWSQGRGDAGLRVGASEPEAAAAVSQSEHMIVAARRAASLSALEGGLLRLEAARAGMKRGQPLSRLPGPRMQAVGMPPPRREERCF